MSSRKRGEPQLQLTKNKAIIPDTLLGDIIESGKTCNNMSPRYHPGTPRGDIIESGKTCNNMSPRYHPGTPRGGPNVHQTSRTEKNGKENIKEKNEFSNDSTRSSTEQILVPHSIWSQIRSRSGNHARKTRAVSKSKSVVNKDKGNENLSNLNREIDTKRNEKNYRDSYGRDDTLFLYHQYNGATRNDVLVELNTIKKSLRGLEDELKSAETKENSYRLSLEDFREALSREISHGNRITELITELNAEVIEAKRPLKSETPFFLIKEVKVENREHVQRISYLERILREHIEEKTKVEYMKDEAEAMRDEALKEIKVLRVGFQSICNT